MHEIRPYGEPRQRFERAKCQDCGSSWSYGVGTENKAMNHARLHVHRVEIITETYIIWGPTND